MQIGSFGTLVFYAYELMGLSKEYDMGYKQIPKISGATAIQKLGDRPSVIRLQIRYNDVYNANPRAAATNVVNYAKTTTTPQALIIGTQNYGNFVISNIRVAEQNYFRIRVDLDIEFLEVA
ncbi:MAG: phage tail protein [Brasilonema angustatum HA4187-MV1]|jgi:hypothetical protein|nr:phage tail protein [Brasilonema angustatum HA4187-MV1]